MSTCFTKGGPVSNFQVYDMILCTLVTRLYIRVPQLIYLRTNLTVIVISQYISISNHHILYLNLHNVMCPRWFSGKESACQAGDASSIPGSGRSPGEGNGNLLQYSCLGNPVDRGTWKATVHGVAKSQI